MQERRRTRTLDQQSDIDPGHPLYPIAAAIEQLLLPILRRGESRLADGMIRIVDRQAFRFGEEKHAEVDPLCVQLFLPNGSPRYEWMKGNRWVRGSVSIQFVCESKERITLLNGADAQAWEFPVTEIGVYIKKVYEILHVPYVGPVSSP